jgi:hypothetical protein
MSCHKETGLFSLTSRRDRDQGEKQSVTGLTLVKSEGNSGNRYVSTMGASRQARISVGNLQAAAATIRAVCFSAVPTAKIRET